ncbi:glycoside hydrolase family 5 protein [Asticcacaulis sp. 201]|uniref:glycoside hydrolase family 5 protein n=1 Tax=Asticcacaulis sp. 201 TaxID=3028787 RepID=UPI002915C77F|nr:glycoside hydrolase family 5 protein [Asticcacaulis sp. 201]MDV6332990.1 glycoside hydrolase family 5 protein [Asticcacaulis sp. 201]
MLKRSAGITLALALAAGATSAAAQSKPFVDISAADQVAAMGPGVNIIGYDPYWQDGDKGNYKEAHFKAIHEAGFKTIRVVLFTFKHMDQDGRLDPAWLKKLDWVVEMGKKYNLTVILDEHDFDACSKDAKACGANLRNVWSQLATRYADEPNSVIFELLNEPHDALNGAVWNEIFPQVLAVVRASNPTRNVIIGPTHWNSRNDLDDLKLPEADRHIIVTFHYYDPFRFTHQGASWAPPEITALRDIHFGTPAEIAEIGKDFDAVKAWSVTHDRPILLGEFGAYDRAAMADRVVWTNAVARAAEAHGFAFAYWQFSSDFIVYDFKKQQWVKPILNALIPNTTANKE